MPAPYVTAQGTSSGWYYRRWSDKTYECWKTVSTSITSGNWTAWGSIYQSTTFARQNLPITLTAGHYEYVTAHATQDWSSWAMILDPPTTTQTGSYKLCRGAKPSDTAVWAIDYYVRGVAAS